MMSNADKIATHVWKDGGATWNLQNDEPVFGFMVSLKDSEYVTSVYDFGPDVVQAYVDATPLPDGAFYGAWINDDQVYLDVSINVATFDEAMMIADIEDQHSVFDVYDQQVVFAGFRDQDITA